MKHDAYRQIGYIQQSLSQNRKALGVFLGAGCPLAIRIADGTETKPLIPDVAGLTRIITEKLKGSLGTPSDCDKLVSLIKEDGITNPTIENILSQLRLMRQVAGIGKVREFSSSDLEVLDKNICKIISNEVNKELPNRDTPYHNLAIWARSIPRTKPLHLFTTNYDLLIEQALEETSCPYFDGFVGSKKAFFDLGTVEDEALLHPRWSRLWKIHGSVNWKIDKDKNIVRGDNVSETEQYLIYPSHLKYDQSRKMPYLALLDRLKYFLLSPSAVLFISGYSFSDDHINDVIVQALQSNPTAMAFAFLFGKLDGSNYSKAKKCAFQIPNLSVLAFDKGIVGRQEGEWTLVNDELLAEIPAHSIRKNVKKEGEGEDEKETISYEITLGDFETLGQFLKEMSTMEVGETKENEK
jgi:hypothetical protein